MEFCLPTGWVNAQFLHQQVSILTRMAFKHFAKQTRGVELLQRSLARGRLGHAYLFAGDQLEELESLARTLAKTLNCQSPVKTGGVATDCCDACLSCRNIDHDTQ